MVAHAAKSSYTRVVRNHIRERDLAPTGGFQEPRCVCKQTPSYDHPNRRAPQSHDYTGPKQTPIPRQKCSSVYDGIACDTQEHVGTQMPPPRTFERPRLLLYLPWELEPLTSSPAGAIARTIHPHHAVLSRRAQQSATIVVSA